MEKEVFINVCVRNNASEERRVDICFSLSDTERSDKIDAYLYDGKELSQRQVTIDIFVMLGAVVTKILQLIEECKEKTVVCHRSESEKELWDKFLPKFLNI